MVKISKNRPFRLNYPPPPTRTSGDHSRLTYWSIKYTTVVLYCIKISGLTIPLSIRYSPKFCSLHFESVCSFLVRMYYKCLLRRYDGGRGGEINRGKNVHFVTTWLAFNYHTTWDWASLNTTTYKIFHQALSSRFRLHYKHTHSCRQTFIGVNIDRWIYW